MAARPGSSRLSCSTTRRTASWGSSPPCSSTWSRRARRVACHRWCTARASAPSLPKTSSAASRTTTGGRPSGPTSSARARSAAARLRRSPSDRFMARLQCLLEVVHIPAVQTMLAVVNPVKSRREEYSAATREALLESATALFAEHGYTRASLDEIAGRARVTKGALYGHFASKQALFRAVLDHLEASTTREVTRAIE